MTALCLDESSHRNGAIRTVRNPSQITEREIRTLDDVRHLFNTLTHCLAERLQGCDDVIAQALTALFADGHVLLESQPGGGKTELATTLGRTFARAPHSGPLASFRRIQFTPDLLPSDVTGVTMFDPDTKEFVFRNGPVFANIVLADEINRTSPKVQAALLEAMAEKQVTVDNQTHRLEDLFFVMATQNPVDLSGTFPLPRAQLDRFLFKIKLPPLSREKQLEVLAKRTSRPAKPQAEIEPAAIVRARQIITEEVSVKPIIHEGLVDIAEAIRADKRVLLALSTRALVLAVPALQVWALVNGRDFVSPRDLKSLAVPLFSHRLELVPGIKDGDAVVTECVTPVIESITRRTLR